MTPIEARQLWVQALRSGEFKQGTGSLHSRPGDEDRYCCLGVACEVYQRHVGGLCVAEESGVKTYNRHKCTLPFPVAKWLNINEAGAMPTDSLPNPNLKGLVGLNDIAMYNFGQIADVIESGVLRPYSEAA